MPSIGLQLQGQAGFGSALYTLLILPITLPIQPTDYCVAAGANSLTLVMIDCGSKP